MSSRTESDVAAVRPGLLRGGPSAVAVQILVIGYLVGFAVSVADAVAALELGPKDPAAAGDQPATAFVGYLILLALAVAAGLITMRACQHRLGLSTQDLGLRASAATWRRAPVTALMYVAVLAAAVGLTEAVLALCRVSSSGVDAGIPNGPGVLPVEIFHSVIAGVVEEPVLLAVPIALGRRCRWRWQLTLALMIAMRIAFHVYAGWNCLFVVPWIAAAFVLYRWCSLLWPFIVAHGIFDVLQVLRAYGGHSTVVAAQSLLAVAVAAGAVAGVVGCRRAGLFDRAAPHHGAAATTSAAATRNERVIGPDAAMPWEQDDHGSDAGQYEDKQRTGTNRAPTPLRQTPGHDGGELDVTETQPGRCDKHADHEHNDDDA